MDSSCGEPDTQDMVRCFNELADQIDGSANTLTPSVLVHLLTLHPNDILGTKGGSFRQYRKKGRVDSGREAPRPFRGRCDSL